MEIKVNLVSGLIGEYVTADCYINGEYFDFWSSSEGYKLVNEFGLEVPMASHEYTEIEKQIREQFNGLQRKY